MKFFYILLFTIASTNISLAQLYYVSTPTINATNNWYTKIYTKFTCSSNASTMGHSFNIDYTNKIINLVSCYTGPGIFPVVTIIKDTINIGALPQGNYTLNYTVFISGSYSVCAPYDTILSTHTFNAGPNSLKELNNENEFQISPNPVKDYFKIKSDDNKAVFKKAEILNILGDKVLEINDPSFNTNIDLSSLPNGLYLLSLYTEKNSLIKKIIKE
jgi:hypothetical protein